MRNAAAGPPDDNVRLRRRDGPFQRNFRHVPVNRVVGQRTRLERPRRREERRSTSAAATVAPARMSARRELAFNYSIGSRSRPQNFFVIDASRGEEYNSARRRRPRRCEPALPRGGLCARHDSALAFSSSSAPVLPSRRRHYHRPGGSIGASYHLQKLGLNAVLIEGDELTSGTTWHSAGLLWQLAGMAGQMDADIAGCAVHAGSSPRRCRLRLTASGRAGSTRAPSLRAAGASARSRTTGRGCSRRRCTAPRRTTCRRQRRRRCTCWMRVDDLHSAVYVPGDGTIDPSALVRARTRGGEAARREDLRAHARHRNPPRRRPRRRRVHHRRRHRLLGRR